jgi:hypothetical protein
MNAYNNFLNILFFIFFKNQFVLIHKSEKNYFLSSFLISFNLYYILTFLYFFLFFFLDLSSISISISESSSSSSSFSFLNYNRKILSKYKIERFINNIYFILHYLHRYQHLHIHRYHFHLPYH